jgi:thiol-disulfide isomerase/thioredoxin
MNEQSDPSELPSLPVEAVRQAVPARAQRISRRNALIAVAGVAALILGRGLYRQHVARSDAGLTTFDVHPVPRDLGPLRFSDARGAPQSLAAFRGRVVLLNVWATWCPPCREEMPTLDRLQDGLGGSNFEVVAVSIDTEGLPVVQTFFRQIGIKHLHPYLDTFMEVGALGAMGIPLTLLIDRDGCEAGRKVGPATWDDPTLVQTIRGYLPAARS